ncbi:hypothetical protein AYI68_g2037 [Smittium mucronatum]|uniref:Uncharacterized protein n=1 Tax=Smittium mucronatum TaxID=133383 RepID=A0A1R0H3W0_9FUNG|nr:hypothetical protein AYI68_g2037 [Smittium mucronatum]
MKTIKRQREDIEVPRDVYKKAPSTDQTIDLTWKRTIMKMLWNQKQVSEKEKTVVKKPSSRFMEIVDSAIDPQDSSSKRNMTLASFFTGIAGSYKSSPSLIQSSSTVHNVQRPSIHAPTCNHCEKSLPVDSQNVCFKCGGVYCPNCSIKDYSGPETRDICWDCHS